MPWKRMMFKGHKVYAEVDEQENLLVRKDRVKIKYAPDDTQVYSAAPRNIQDLDEEKLFWARKWETLQARGQSGRPTKEVISPDSHLVIFTDGASSGNPGPAGVGVVLRYQAHEKKISLPIGEATNNVAELLAIKEGLGAVRRVDLPVRVFTDSKYALGVLTGRMKAKQNIELVDEIRAIMQSFPDLRFVKVPGHANVAANELADRLARQALER